MCLAILMNKLVRQTLTVLTFSAYITWSSPSLGSDLIATHKLLLDQSQRLSDAELADIRGRYIDKNAVLFFGIEMVSHLQTDNMQYAAQVSLVLDFRGSEHQIPRATVALSVPNGQLNDDNISPNTANLPLNGAIYNVEGSMQTIQISGHGNDVINEISIQLNSGKAVSELSVFENMGIELSEQGRYLVEYPNGGLTAVTFSDDTLEYTLSVPEIGEIRQSIFEQGIMQSTHLNSDNNTVRNYINMQLIQETGASNYTSGPNPAFGLIRGIPGLGGG